MSIIDCTKDSKCPELELETRKRLVTKSGKATNRDWITEILRLSVGDARRHQSPQSKSDISVKLGISRPTVDSFIKMGIEHKLIDTDESGKIKIPDVEKAFGSWSYYEDESFMQDPLIKEWIENLLTKKNGKPVKTWKSRYSALKRMCNTLKIKPAQLIVDKKTYLEILKNLSLGLQQGTLLNDNGRNNAKTWETGFHWMKMASRDFVQFHGIALPKGMGGVASGKVILHGQYADVRLTDAELDAGDKFIVENYGLDSDIMRVWGVGIEGGARKVALLKMELQWDEHFHKKTNQRTLIMKAYETKTEKWWKKYIKRPLTQQSLEAAKKRHQAGIIELGNKSFNVRQKEIADQLREVYKHLDKATIHNGYFLAHPFHALRHTASQNQIRWSNGNLTWVCLAVGWGSDLELKASYGELPPEIVLGMVDNIGAVA